MVVAANVMAMLVQYLAGKLGPATGRNLPQLCRERYPRPVTWGCGCRPSWSPWLPTWPSSSGAAIALNLLFGVPLLPAGLITAVVTLAVLSLRPRGRRRFGTAIIAMLAVVLAGPAYLVNRRLTTAAGATVSALIIALNVVLLAGV